MYNEKIYLDWIEIEHPLWLGIVKEYSLNWKRSFFWFTENEYRQDEYLIYSKKYFKKEKK